MKFFHVDYSNSYRGVEFKSSLFTQDAVLVTKGDDVQNAANLAKTVTLDDGNGGSYDISYEGNWFDDAGISQFLPAGMTHYFLTESQQYFRFASPASESFPAINDFISDRYSDLASADNAAQTWFSAIANYVSTLEATRVTTVELGDDGGELGTITASSARAVDQIVHLGLYFDNKGMKITGSDYNDALYGANGHDKLLGKLGDDMLLGGKGRDNLHGGQGNDSLYGQAGNDSLFGGNGTDMLVGGNGSDWLRGGRGDDTLSGGKAWDYLYGERGNDILYGQAGGDWLVGGNGHDRLAGGRGADILYGGKGWDTLDGGRGDDILNGGAGNDVFVFGDGDIVEDFKRGDDVIELEYDVTFDDLEISISGSDTHIHIADDVMVLKNVTDTLDAGDFIFW